MAHMVAPAQRLPFEVLLQIFGYLREPTAQAVLERHRHPWVPEIFFKPQYEIPADLALVCRNWREAAQVQLYEAVSLHTLARRRLFWRSVEHAPALASYVKSVVYHRDEMCLPIFDGVTEAGKSAVFSSSESSLAYEPNITASAFPHCKSLVLSIIKDTIPANFVNKSSVKTLYLNARRRSTVNQAIFKHLPACLTHLHFADINIPEGMLECVAPQLQYLGLDLTYTSQSFSVQVKAPKLTTLYLAM